MVTAGNLEMPAVIRVKTRFHVLNPSAINTQRHLILTFTSRGTGVASNTLAIIDDEAVIHKHLLPRGSIIPYLKKRNVNNFYCARPDV
jgi:hypothetical protein